MKISYNWLKEFVDFNLTPKETAQLITFSGIETNLITAGNDWQGVITAKVLECGKHPQADKLSFCKVTDGKKEYSIVCGAPNVAAGQTIGLATEGAELPGGVKIKRTKIRGIESEGMICSQKELGLTEDTSGIMVLQDGTPLGKPLQEALGQTDSLLEVEIPSNRPDVLSHWGVAREIGAKLSKPVKLPEIKLEKLPESWNKISITDPELCARYIGIKITGIKVGPSPEWMADKLKKCGLRPINNIVDITNYVLLELGHPLHAFDLAKLAGGEIIVRRAYENEKILALDGKEYKLDTNMLVIGDAEKAQAIAGVMGGETSGVKDGTTDIVLESAMFKPQSVRKTSKTLNLSSDASYRFERGAGWTVCEMAAYRAAKLVCEIAGGKIESKFDKIVKDYKPAVIDMRFERAAKLTGMQFEKSEVTTILSSLGMKVTESADKVTCEVPSWRIDVSQEVDLIEEITRVKGYENVPVTIMPVIPSAESPALSAQQTISERLFALGFSQAVNYSFAEVKELDFLKIPVTMKVSNPMSKENEAMRPALLAGLWRNVILNLRQGYSSVRLFETGTVFAKDSERVKLAFAASGDALAEWWGWESKKVDPAFNYYYFAGIAENILSGNKIKLTECVKCAAYFHPGKTASIEMNGKNIGEIGMLHPELSNEAGKDVWYCELDLELIEKIWNRSRKIYKPISHKPMVRRDMSILAKKAAQFSGISDILDRFVASKDSHLSGYELFSRYEGEKLGADNISYSFHLVFRHPELTLTDAEVNTQFESIVQALNKEFGITLR